MKPVCGSSEYPEFMMGGLDELLHDAQQLARRLVDLVRSGRAGCDGAATVYVYGALAPGWLAAHVLADHPPLRVAGCIDRDAERLRGLGALGLHHCGAPSALPVFAPGDPVLREAEARAHIVVVATAPRHHEAVARTLRGHLPDAAVVFLHRSPCAQPAVPPHRPFFVTTPGRCGTLWMTRMLKALLRAHGYRLVDSGHATGGDRAVLHPVAEILAPDRFCVDHFRVTDTLRDRVRCGDLAGIHLYRDPRDMQVSASFYNHGAFRYDARYLETKLAQIREWRDVPGMLHVRYEDLRADTPGALARVLAHIGVRESTERIRAVADLFSFRHLSGGRKPGQEDPASHYRKGVCGDWKNYYDDESERETRRRFGDCIAALGYEP